MHHKKPIFQYQGDDLIQTIKNAVINIIPVCSNCHRMIHKYKKQPLQVDLLISHIKNNGVYNILNV